MDNETKQETTAQSTSESKLLEAVQKDENLLNIFSELNGSTDTQEATVTETGEGGDDPAKADKSEPEVQSGAEESIGTQETNEPVWYKDYRKDDGTYDTDKLLKSLDNAKRVIGKTSSERSEYNKYKEAHETLSTLVGIMNKDPELAKAVDRAVLRSRGELVEDAGNAAPKITSKEELNKLVEQAYAKGDYVEANKLLNAHDEHVRRALAAAEIARQEAMSIKQAEDKRKKDGELEAFVKSHIQDGLFDESGNVVDQELFSEMVNTYNYRAPNGAPIYESVPFEDVLAIAKSRLKRHTQPVQRAAVREKERVVAASNARSKPAVRQATSTQEAIPGLGISVDDLEAFLKDSR